MKLSLLTLFFLSITHDAISGPLPTVNRFEAARYTGTWYEIAKFPNWAQRHCVAENTIRYQLDEQNQLILIRRCRKEDGTFEEQEGLARPLGSPDSPHLEATFWTPWLRFAPVAWHDHWIIDLDSQYQLAAVGDPSRQSLWILSRLPHVNPQAYNALQSRLVELGFDINKLETVPQP